MKAKERGVVGGSICWVLKMASNVCRQRLYREWGVGNSWGSQQLGSKGVRRGGYRFVCPVVYVQQLSERASESVGSIVKPSRRLEMPFASA